MIIIRPRGYKSFFTLNSAEHEISSANKTKIPKSKEVFFALNLLDVVFIILINVKMPTFMSRINFVLS